MRMKRLALLAQYHALQYAAHYLRMGDEDCQPHKPQFDDTRTGTLEENVRQLINESI